MSELVGKRPPQRDIMTEVKITDDTVEKPMTKAELGKLVDDMFNARMKELYDNPPDKVEDEPEISMEDYLNEIVEERVNALIQEKKSTKREIEPAGTAKMSNTKESIYNQLKAFGFKDPEDAYNKYFVERD